MCVRACVCEHCTAKHWNSVNNKNNDKNNNKISNTIKKCSSDCAILCLIIIIIVIIFSFLFTTSTHCWASILFLFYYWYFWNSFLSFFFTQKNMVTSIRKSSNKRSIYGIVRHSESYPPRRRCLHVPGKSLKCNTPLLLLLFSCGSQQ